MFRANVVSCFRTARLSVAVGRTAVCSVVGSDRDRALVLAMVQCYEDKDRFLVSKIPVLNVRISTQFHLPVTDEG